VVHSWDTGDQGGGWEKFPQVAGAWQLSGDGAAVNKGKLTEGCGFVFLLSRFLIGKNGVCKQKPGGLEC
jgi:hypothetical protein